MAQSYQSHQDTSARGREGQDTVRDLKQKAGEAAETAANEGARMLKAAGEQAEDAYAATKRFVQSQPLLAIGAVAAFACAVGALWKLAPARRDGLVDRVTDYMEPHYRNLRRRL